MSQTIEQHGPDQYLMSQVAPQQTLELNPQFGSVRMITPVGRLTYVTLVKPRAVKQPNGQDGQPNFSCTVLLNPAACQDIYRAIVMVANNRWQGERRPNPNNPSEFVVMTGEQLLALPREQGGLHYPLRRGDDVYMRDPVKYGAYRGLFALNASIAATNQATGSSQQPVALDESGERTDIARFYSGCYGRLQVTFFAFPKQGANIPNRGVGVSLNAVQFAKHGDKLATYDAEGAAKSAFAQVGALPMSEPAPSGAFGQPGFGPNAMTPGAVPPGFAPPPAHMQGVPQPTGPVPPQQPWQPAAPAARPPGM